MTPAETSLWVRILGIDFFVGGDAIFERLLNGGLVVIPSAPGLADDLQRFPAYHDALLGADYVIPDSGLMVLLWNGVVGRNRKIQRYSGLRLVRGLLSRPELKAPGTTFWVMPNKEEMYRAVTWLQTTQAMDVSPENCYVAPYYRDKRGPRGSVEDPELLRRIRAQRPQFIFVNVGSGVQEQLGSYLAANLTERPAIICSGAAISFLTGGQGPIPDWADRFYLGWLLRLLRNPIGFAPRLLGAIKLIPMMLRDQQTRE